MPPGATGVYARAPFRADRHSRRLFASIVFYVHSRKRRSARPLVAFSLFHFGERTGKGGEHEQARQSAFARPLRAGHRSECRSDDAHLRLFRRRRRRHRAGRLSHGRQPVPARRNGLSERAADREPQFLDAIRSVAPPARRRLVLLTTKGEANLWDFAFAEGDIILVGRESAGVPESVAQTADARLRIPILPPLRSLNVGVAAAIALAEALRQIGRPPGRNGKREHAVFPTTGT
jgi:hypothetical protein